MTGWERFKRMFSGKRTSVKPVPPPVKPAEPEAPHWGTIEGNMYSGTAKYIPVEPIDEAKYQLYLTQYCNRRNPKTGSYWTMWELAPELDISVQNALDMISRAQIEWNNGYLPGTVPKN